MPSNYTRLKADNVRRYGEDIGRIGPMLLAHRYDNRAHFIFELLQNAEDALRRTQDKTKPKSVRFHLQSDALNFSHFGHPFSENDVQFICGIGESTDAHTLTDIGRFGIGFKSVYAFTDAPEIHSSSENFAIDSFVWPRAITPAHTAEGETVFRFPFRKGDASAHTDIARGLAELGLPTLLFLREIDQIDWVIEGGESGSYLRETKHLEPQVREIRLLGQKRGQANVEEEAYIVFERPVAHGEKPSGRVEIAFRLATGMRPAIQPIENATLAVFFPTIVPTRFGAILQGPFRTTPSRDNIPRDDPWNCHLVTEMAQLLAHSLTVLKSRRLLDAAAINALPIHRARFQGNELFRPLYEATIGALKTHPLLPCLDGSHRCAPETRLGRTKEIRELLSPQQLGTLLGSAAPVFWISDSVTRDKMPDLRQYMMDELGIGEIEPEAIALRITGQFIAAQSTAWVVQFYEFLNGQESLWRNGGLRNKPIVRLSTGKQVIPFLKDQPQAFLPGNLQTDFPTIHSDFSASRAAFEFLKKLGLTEPDPVDDIILNLLPKFTGNNFAPSESEYANGIERILEAAGHDLKKSQRDKLVSALRETPFLAAVDCRSSQRLFVVPPRAYQATERLKALFAGVSGLLIVDSAFGGLKGEAVRDLLESCGCAEYLVPESVAPVFSSDELRVMRQTAGFANNTGVDRIEDQTLRGLDALINHLVSLPFEEASGRAAILWESLCDVEERRGAGVFSGTYRWFYNSARSCAFAAAFVRKLQVSAWVPKSGQLLALPSEVVFEDITPRWKVNAFVLSKISFKPRAVVELAQMVGIDPGVLDLLRKYGLTSEAELKQRLGIADAPATGTKDGVQSPQDAIAALLGGSAPPTASVGGSTTEFAPGSGTRPGTGVHGIANGETHGPRGGTVGGSRSSSVLGGSGSHGSGPARHAFHTYVAVAPEDEPDDPEQLNQAERLQIEQSAIAFILKKEPTLKTTPQFNPGFDLFEGESLGSATRFVEVKSRKGPWAGPVALSGTQFRKAQEEGNRFWLYVVENAANPESIRLHAIQDPAGKAHHFCFDPGWSALANP